MYDYDTTPEPKTSGGPNTLAYALSYAADGWRVLPLHAVRPDGRCTCGRSDCTSAGKHPRITGGVHNATTDNAQIRAWWAHFSEANIGVACGAVSGIVVLDVDTRAGGHKTLSRLTREHGPLPETLTVITGSGGKHYYFRHPGEEIRSHRPGEGLDLQSDGKYVVAPPSSHVSGSRYKWAEAVGDRNLRQLAPLPEWLVRPESSGSDTRLPPLTQIDRIPVGGRNTTLTRIAGRYRRQGMEQAELELLLQAINETRCERSLSRDEVEQIARSVSRYEPEKTPTTWSKNTGQVELVGRRASEIEPEEIDWLWEPRLARGKVNALVGDPACGKSTIAIEIAARLSTGRPMPMSESPVEPASTLFLSAEDGAADTIVPRLMAAGADLDAVEIIEEAKEDRERRTICLPEHVDALERRIEELDAGLVVIDPLKAFLSANSYKEQEVRKAIYPLQLVAAHTGATILFIAHLNKDAEKKALHRVGGSTAFVAAPRSALLVERHPLCNDDGVIAQLKNNLAGKAPSLAYSFEETKEGSSRLKNWRPSSYGKEELLRSQSAKKSTKREQAQEYLKAKLADGPVLSSSLTENIDEFDFSTRTLERARDDLGVVPKKDEFQGETWAMLPEHVEQFEEDGPPFDPELAETGSNETEDHSAQATRPEIASMEKTGTPAPAADGITDSDRQGGEDRETPDGTLVMGWIGPSHLQFRKEVG